MKCIITAGGKGSRLLPMTRAIPKELIPFCGIPVVEYCIRYLKDNGITDIIVIVGPKKSPIMDYTADGKLFGVNIAYVIQDKPLGLGHSLLTVENYIGNDNEENFILLLGDTILFGDSDLKDMIENHKNHKASVTILLEHITKKPEKYGIVKFNYLDNRVLSIIEKPTSKDNQEEYKTTEYKTTYSSKLSKDIKGSISLVEGWYAVAGLYVLNRNIFDFIRKTKKDINGEIQLTDAIRLSLNSKDIVMGHVLNGKRIDVGNWEYLKDEREYYRNMSDIDLENVIKSREEMILRDKEGVKE